MNELIRKKIDEWTRPPFDKDTIEEIKNLVGRNDEKELEDRFYRILEFGTGGLRGILGAGTNRMNIYTIGMATQGLANHILKAGEKSRGVVVARDSRRFSDIFARETASILAGNGIAVYLFDDIMPTPLTSYAIRYLKTISGVVITASHNPPEYNGYKVYWEDGGQIIPPHDGLIIKEVSKIDSMDKIKRADFDEGRNSGLIKIVGDEITAAYIKELELKALRPIGASNIKIAYTPLHGTGYKIIPRVLKHFGFTNLFLQEEQSKPDGGFPTVKYPNPEVEETMKLVTDLARERDADIIMASDPDADRMGIGFKGSDGRYRLINGNQIGSMLEYYLLARSRENGTLKKNAAVIKSIVTTDLQREIAEDFDCKTYNVLTGFKWIASKMREFDETGDASFLFGGEESYGYLPVDFVRDKDAVSSCYFFAEMTDWLSGRGMSLQDFLDEIYIKYGLYLEGLHSLTLTGVEGSRRIGAIMESFRKAPPRQFCGIKVAGVLDIENLVGKNLLAGTEEKITSLPSSNVLQFILSDGSKITIRPSGTEPKIKFYFSVREEADADTLDEGKASITKKLESLKQDFMEKVSAV